MKLRWQPLAAIALFPMGIALADYADTAAPAVEQAAPVSPELSSWVESAERSLDQVTRGVQELAIGMQAAKRDGDAMLATCLGDALDRARELAPAAIKNLNSMQQAGTPDAARGVVANITQTNEALAQIFEDASKCRGAEESDRSVIQGDTTVTEVVNDGDPASAPGSGDAPTTPTAGGPPAIIPPAMQPTIDSMDPIVDMPVDMPPVPPTASPMR